MTRQQRIAGVEFWREFVVQHGRRASIHDLAHVTGRTEKEIAALRQKGVCAQVDKPRTFPELFSLWHGRAPADADWPAPRRGGAGSYEWQAREDALLATLVGQLSVRQIAEALTQRLVLLTGDATAARSINTVRLRINRIGLWAGDLLGGLTVQQAGHEIGSVTTVQGAVDKGLLKPRHVGHRVLIPREQWDAWKASRTFPPRGYVPLAPLKEPLGIRSDKLSEFARMGYVPTAVQCNPYGTGTGTKQGCWFISPQTAKKLVADRRAGRAMPWHGKPNPDNLKMTWRLLQERRHPAHCDTCAAIWGPDGPPSNFEDYVKRYPPLAHGAKRHLTRVYSPGLTLHEVAELAKRSLDDVLRAVRNSALRTSTIKRRKYVSRTDATRWIARRCPSGEGEGSWVALATACKAYRFTLAELRTLIESGQLRAKVGTDGAQRGITYVLRQQCAQLREDLGFTEKEAAKRLGVTVPRLQRLLRGVEWRPAPLIPLVTLQAVQKRLESREGFDLAEAAAELGKPLSWVKERIADGTVRVARARWDRRRKYLSAPMLERLRAAIDAPAPLPKVPRHTLTLDQAALDVKVSMSTVRHWAEAGEIERIETRSGWRYPRRSLRSRAVRYWANVRFHRATPPRWLDQQAKG